MKIILHLKEKDEQINVLNAVISRKGKSCIPEIVNLREQLKQKDAEIEKKDLLNKAMSKIIEDAFGCEYCKKVPCANIETRRCSGFEFQAKE